MIIFGRHGVSEPFSSWAPFLGETHALPEFIVSLAHPSLAIQESAAARAVDGGLPRPVMSSQKVGSPSDYLPRVSAPRANYHSCGSCGLLIIGEDHVLRMGMVFTHCQWYMTALQRSGKRFVILEPGSQYFNDNSAVCGGMGLAPPSEVSLLRESWR